MRNIDIKTRTLFIANLLVLVVFALIFRMGGNAMVLMIPVILIVSIMNTVMSASTRSMLLWNTALGGSTVAGLLLSAFLFFNFVKRDTIGALVLAIELVMMIVFVIAITVVEYMIIRNRK